MAGLKAVDAQIDSTKRKLLELKEAMLGSGFDLPKITAETTAIKREVDSVKESSNRAAAAMKDMKIGDAETASNVAKLGLTKRELKAVEDQALRTAAAEHLAAEGAVRNQQVFSDALRLRDEQVRQFGEPLRGAGGGIPVGPAFTPADTSLGAAYADMQRRNDENLTALRNSSGAIPMGAGGSGSGAFRGLGDAERAYMDARKAERYFGGVTPSFPFSGGGASRDNGLLTALRNFAGRNEGNGGGGAGFGNSPGYSGGPLAGILPGGARARPLALLSLLGLAGAAGVGAGPGVAGFGAAALPAALESLGGAAVTLKLAFAGITAASFKTQKAFDKLDPAQQQFVQSLRSIDAGFIKPLEKLAQTNLFPKLVDSLRLALSPAATSAVRGAVGGFSNAIGGGAVDLGHLFGSTGFAQNFGAVMQADARYLKVFIDAFGNLIDALFVFQRAAIPFTDWLSKSFAGLTQWVDAALKADAANGRLAQFFAMAKTSLQSLGGLFMSVAHLAGAFADAVGFQNGIGVINLLRDAINAISDVLHKNAHVLNEFFAGALGSAHDLLNATKSVFNVLTPFLGFLNRIVGGTKGWRIAIDLVVGALVAYKTAIIAATIATQIFEDVSTFGFAAIATAAGLATVYIITHWSQVTKGITLLWRAAVQTIKGILNGMVYAFLIQFAVIVKAMAKAFGWVPFFGKQLTGISNEFSSWVQGFATAAQNDFASAGNNIALAFGNALNSQMQAQLQKTGAIVVGNSPHYNDPLPDPGTLDAKRAAAYYSKHQAFTTTLPKGLSNAIIAAQAGHGDVAKANAAAYGFFENILKNPDLTQAQKTAIYSVEAQYAPTPAFGTPEALDQTGMPKPKKPPHPAGVALLTNALQQRLATAQGNDANSTLSTARALKAADVAAQTYLEHLRASGVSQKEISAIDRELTTLKREQARTQKEINADLKAQHIAGVQKHFASILGIGGDGIASVTSLRSRERQTLIGELKRDKIPFTADESLKTMIHSLQSHGDLPKSTAESLKKINAVLDLSQKEHVKLTQEVSANVAARLTEINDTLKQALGLKSSYVATSSHTLTAGLGLTTEQRVAMEMRISQSEAHGGKKPQGTAAAGVPLTAGGVPFGYAGHTTHPVQSFFGDISIVIQGAGKNAETLAKELRSEFLKTSRRNPTQSRGPNAGKRFGLN